MCVFHVEFDDIDWTDVQSGCRVKSVERNSTRLRIVEFGTEFVEADWCHRGHVGYVIDGELVVEFDGHETVFRRGDGLMIPAGDASRHRARVESGVATLVLVEDASNSQASAGE